MRSDYALYAVAIVFFILTVTAFFALNETEPQRDLWIITTAVLGILFIGLGYIQKPKTAAISTISQPTSVTTATYKKEETETARETIPPADLTHVKGIGEKRAEQLRTLGIKRVEDLAKAPPKDIAAKLKISPKITRKWVEDAGKITKKQ